MSEEYLCTKLYTLEIISDDKLTTSVEDDSTAKVNTNLDRPKGILHSHSCRNNGTNGANKFVKKYSMFKNSDTINKY